MDSGTPLPTRLSRPCRWLGGYALPARHPGSSDQLDPSEKSTWYVPKRCPKASSNLWSWGAVRGALGVSSFCDFDFRPSLMCFFIPSMELLSSYPFSFSSIPSSNETLRLKIPPFTDECSVGTSVSSKCSLPFWWQGNDIMVWSHNHPIKPH